MVTLKNAPGNQFIYIRLLSKDKFEDLWERLTSVVRCSFVPKSILISSHIVFILISVYNSNFYLAFLKLL